MGEEGDGDPPHANLVDGHCCQGRRDETGQVDVVEPNDRKLLRNHESVAPCRLKERHSYGVVSTEDGADLRMCLDVAKADLGC